MESQRRWLHFAYLTPQDRVSSFFSHLDAAYSSTSFLSHPLSECCFIFILLMLSSSVFTYSSIEDISASAAASLWRIPLSLVRNGKYSFRPRRVPLESSSRIISFADNGACPLHNSTSVNVFFQRLANLLKSSEFGFSAPLLNGFSSLFHLSQPFTLRHSHFLTFLAPHFKSWLTSGDGYDLVCCLLEDSGDDGEFLIGGG